MVEETGVEPSLHLAKSMNYGIRGPHGGPILPVILNLIDRERDESSRAHYGYHRMAAVELKIYRTVRFSKTDSVMKKSSIRNLSRRTTLSA